MTVIKMYQRTALCMLLSSMTLTAYAAAPGFYMGFAGGPATNNGSEQTVKTASGTPATTIAKPESQQFNSQIFMGNKINNYISAELGFSFFSNIKYTTKYPPLNGLVSRVRDIGGVAKIGYPFGNGFEVYGKVGGAYAYITTSGGFNSNGRTRYEGKFVPQYGVGGSYDLNQNWVIDLSANALPVSGIVGRMSYITLGLSYHFVNTYCGQFLCDD